MRNRQRGVAVVMAMSVVTLAALAATAMLMTQSTWSRETELQVDHAQAETLIQAGVDWARAVLGDDRRLSNVDHLKEPWALRLPPMPIDNGELAGYIEDQQGAFNLNNIVVGGKVSAVQLERFKRLLAFLGLPPALAYSVADWIDADSEQQTGAGAEDEYYLALKSPYLAANRPLTDVSELALVRGFTTEVLTRLGPFVSALPANTPVNVNTASAEVLATVIDGLDLDSARALVAQRERAYFRDYADFTNRLPHGLQAADSDIKVSSNYFIAHVRVTIGGAEARGLALLSRGDIGWPVIVWRRYE
ncbi:MAG TPA: type II secretion system minor pseudopilin GspK [Burkholderiales bacterium]|nr:type II secretion system minor pseudopilin GspK [Burkholderiales bacterium]